MRRIFSDGYVDLAWTKLLAAKSLIRCMKAGAPQNDPRKRRMFFRLSNFKKLSVLAQILCFLLKKRGVLNFPRVWSHFLKWVKETVAKLGLSQGGPP